MNIKILDSWLREYLKTDATPQKIAEVMSQTSVGIERIEKYKNDYIYDIEITTNRPDLMSVVGLAREASSALKQFKINAGFQNAYFQKIEQPKADDKVAIQIINDPKLVYRVCAVVMEITIKPTPPEIQERLETSDIRHLNNIIDVTNYVMRTIGHPTHVFDFDRLNSKRLIIRESKKDEEITTLDGKSFILPGGDIVAENDHGEIVDLLGVMGLQNSVVTSETKRILFFIDNNDSQRMRKTSMTLSLRSEAVQMNEKHIDPELALDALKYGVQLYKEIADAKVISDVIDIYPKKFTAKTIDIEKEKFSKIIGVKIENEVIKKILESLGLLVKEAKDNFTVTIPSWRARDLQIPEDIVEEVARMYGYHNIPSALPQLTPNHITDLTNEFYWENRVKQALKYWGFTEVYTYSMVPETMYEGNPTNAVKIQNPLSEDWVYMRNTLVPSLLKTISENSTREEIKIFEIANVYHKRQNNLPSEEINLAGILKSSNITIFNIKGIFEQLAKDLEIKNLTFKTNGEGNMEINIEATKIGYAEILEKNLIDFECSITDLIKYATTKKNYTPIPKYPALVEDMTFVFTEDTTVGEIIEIIKKQSQLIKNVELLDKYKNTRTFRITYQHIERNLTTIDIAPIREKIIKTLKIKNLKLK